MSSNYAKGLAFQLRCREALIKMTGLSFEAEIKLPIGTPPKPHAFDLVSSDGTLVAECKAFTWTTSAKPPSAKISTLREAIGYLHQLPTGTTRILLMKRDCNVRNGESLADYFVRLNRHFLGTITILELAERGELRVVYDG
jgi:hypothetical protein